MFCKMLVLKFIQEIYLEEIDIFGFWRIGKEIDGKINEFNSSELAY